MSCDETLIDELVAAGTPANLVAKVALALGRAQGEREALDRRRATDRERQNRRRHVTSRDNDNEVSRDVTLVTLQPSPLDDPQPSLPYVEDNLQTSPKEKNTTCSKRKGSNSRASAFPESFEPNTTDLACFAEQGITEPTEMAETLAHFRDHHIAKGNVFKDWHAALRTWLRSPFRTRRATGPPMNGFQRPVPDIAAEIAAGKAEIERRRAQREQRQ